MAPQIGDVAQEQQIIIVDVATQTDDLEEEKLVVINIQISEHDTSCTSQVVPQLEEKHIQQGQSLDAMDQQAFSTIELAPPQ